MSTVDISDTVLEGATTKDIVTLSVVLRSEESKEKEGDV